MAGLLVLVWFVPIFAQTEVLPRLYISRFRVSTGGQYFELFNSGENPVDMSKIQLAYYNNYDLSKATSSKLVSLNGELAAGGHYLVNDSSITLCYQTTVASASLSFSSTAGMVQLIYLDQAEIGGTFTSQVLDSVAWSKSQVSQTASVQKLPTHNSDSFLIRQGDYNEQIWEERWPSADDPCQYESVKESVDEIEEFYFTMGSLPPVRYVAASTKSNTLINRNPGKSAPIINEILPNPASPQTDAEDEFIELYNPNDSKFDLTGFKLAFGSTNPRKYTFPEGTIIEPKQYKVFTSGDTSISLSNTKAQVWLLDPNEKIIGTSQPYEKAKDGQAWVLNSGKWMWTLQPTPGKMNAIAQAIDTSTKGKTTAATLGISTTGSSSTGSPSGGTTANELDDAAPLHPAVLAIVGFGALAYTLYEYRQDLSNQIFRTRRYLRRRQTLRKQVQRR